MLVLLSVLLWLVLQHAAKQPRQTASWQRLFSKDTGGKHVVVVISCCYSFPCRISFNSVAHWMICICNRDRMVPSQVDHSRTSWCSGVVVEYQTRNREVAGSTHTRSTASNLEQVANLLCAQASSASYPQWDGKWVVATATGWRPSVADWGDGDGVSASCTMDPIVH